MNPTDKTPLPGVDDPDQFQRQLAAVMIMQAASKTKVPDGDGKPEKAKPEPLPPIDDFERIEHIRAEQRAEAKAHAKKEPAERHRPGGPQRGFLANLAQWLNLR